MYKGCKVISRLVGVDNLHNREDSNFNHHGEKKDRSFSNKLFLEPWTTFEVIPEVMFTHCFIIFPHDLGIIRHFSLPVDDKTYREAALPAVKAIFVHRHPHSDAALLVWARLAQALHLAVVIDAVKLENRKFHGLVNVLDLFRLGVRLLLALLTTTAEAKHLQAKIISFGVSDDIAEGGLEMKEGGKWFQKGAGLKPPVPTAVEGRPDIGTREHSVPKIVRVLYHDLQVLRIPRLQI